MREEKTMWAGERKGGKVKKVRVRGLSEEEERKGGMELLWRETTAGRSQGRK